MHHQNQMDIAAFRPDPLTPEEVDRIRQRLNSEDGNLQLLAVGQLRTLVSSAWTTEEDLDFVVNEGFLPRLVQFLETENPALHFEVGWILTNISASTSFHTGEVVYAGAIPALVQLITSTTQGVSEQAIWALRNIAGDAIIDYRKMVARNGVITPIFELLRKPCPIAILQNVAALISILCNNGLDVEAVDPRLGPMLSFLMYHNDPEVKTYCLTAVTNLTNTKVFTVDRILSQVHLDGFPKITGNYHGILYFQMLRAAIRALATLISFSNKKETALILSYCNTVSTSDTLSSLRDWLYREIPNHQLMKRDILFLLSNILCESEASTYLQQMIDLNLMPAVLTTLKNGAVMNASTEIAKLQTEGIWIIKNFISYGNITQIEYLLQCDLMPTICQLLKTAKDPEVLQLSLVSLGNILKTISSTDVAEVPEEKRIQFFDLIALHKGWESIEKIQENKHVGVSQAAKELLSDYMKVVKASIKVDSTPMEYENTDSTRIYFHCTRGPIY